MSAVKWQINTVRFADSKSIHCHCNELTVLTYNDDANNTVQEFTLVAVVLEFGNKH